MNNIRIALAMKVTGENENKKITSSAIANARNADRKFINQKFPITDFL
jgi:hypothetical protein